uniref:Uncharacterized protein n=1 Tax=Pundamilia nyererei TaxID=303518 RepID=A0A3B4EQG0_9CICH
MCCSYNTRVFNVKTSEVVDLATATDEAIIQRSNKETTMGIYIIKSRDANDSPEDIGIVLEGQRVWQDLDNYTLAPAMMFGIMYTLNLTYPLEKYTFENSLSKKAQVFRTRLYD